MAGHNVSIGMPIVLSGTSPASASTAVLATVTGLDWPRYLQLFANVGGATGGVLDIYFQGSPDGGTTWVDCAHLPQLAAGAAAVRYGFTLTREAPPGAAPVVVGLNLTPALAANVVVPGSWGDRLRVLCVAGASTSAGAALSILGYASS